MTVQRGSYPEDIKDKALELAAAIGMRAAGKRLEIPFQTIHVWSRHPDYAERWSELRRLNAPAWRARAAIPLEDLVDEYGELQAKALRQAHKALEDMDSKDIGNFLRSIAWAQNSAADQAGKLRGQPTVTVQHQLSAPKIEQAIAALIAEAESVDSTAEEVLELPEGD